MGRYGYMGQVVAPQKAGISSLRRDHYAPPPMPDLPATNPESKTTLYIGLGVGAVVVLGGAYLLLRR